VVDGVDLRVPRGSAFGYLGPNGAGKTTTIRMLLGLTGADQGTMRLLGRTVPRDRSTALSRVGALIEEPKFHDHLTARENLRIVAAAREAEARARIDGAIDRVGLRARADERVGKYSTGMRQRLGVARCLLADPDLLILDEPANGLDPAGILEFRQMVGTLVAEGRTVMLSSHLLDEVEKVCDTVAIVDRGRIVAQGPLAELRDGGAHAVVLRSDQAGRASALLTGHPAVTAVEENGEGIRATLGHVSEGEAQSVAADLNRRLVEAGVSVFGIELPTPTLEERFLEITRRMQEEVPA